MNVVSVDARNDDDDGLVGLCQIFSRHIRQNNSLRRLASRVDRFLACERSFIIADSGALCQYYRNFENVGPSVFGHVQLLQLAVFLAGGNALWRTADVHHRPYDKI